MSAFSSVEAFYRADERRRRSREYDYGVWWRKGATTYRITWVVDTGELIAVRMGPHRTSAPIRIAPAEVGIAMLAGDPLDVTVLAIVADEVVVERLLDGWDDACMGPDSIDWIAGRLERRDELEQELEQERDRRARLHLPGRLVPW